MKGRNIIRFLLCISLVSLVGGSPILLHDTLKSSQISSYGKVVYPILVDVSVDFSEVIGTNNLSLGVQVTSEWPDLVNYSELQDKFGESKFRIVRLGIYHTQPNKSWNETSSTGTYDWSRFDQLMETLQKIGTENVLIAVGTGEHAGFPDGGIPLGMKQNFNNTGFPNPESFATYSKDIALHLKENGWTARYWEPYNEPYQAFDNETAYEAFVNLFNAASDAVLQVFPDALFGVDLSNRKNFLDRFVYDGRNVGFLGFHKYDAHGTWLHNSQGYYSDEMVLKLASLLGRKNQYTPQEMRDIWHNIRGVELPVFCTETNLNSVFVNGTDPRIQQVIGATWYAEELRAFILNDVRYSIYYHFGSDASPRWEIDKQTRGHGFGMVNKTAPHLEWYPYQANQLFGNHLNVGDEIYSSSSSNSSAVSVIAWRSHSSYNVLLIGKVQDAVMVRAHIAGANPKNGSISILKIDGSDSKLQRIDDDFAIPFNILQNGYSVMLMKFS